MAAPARNAAKTILSDIRRERLRARLRPSARRAIPLDRPPASPK